MSDFKRKWAASEFYDGSLEEHLLARQDMHLENISKQLQQNNSYSSSVGSGNIPELRVTICYFSSIFFMFAAMAISLGLPNAIVLTATPIFWGPVVVMGAGLDKLTQ